MRTFPVPRSRALAVALSATASFALLFASAAVIAEGADSDSDGVPDSVEAATQRSVVVFVADAGDEFSISSQLVNAPSEDQFGIGYKAGKFEVSYLRPGGGTSSYDLELRNLVEWVDANGNARIDGDEIKATQTLGSSAFGGVLVNHTQTESADDGTVNTILIESRTGEVTLTLTIAERFMRLPSGRVLTPMEVKLDIALDHAFVTPGGASLGLEFRMETEARVEYTDHSWDDLHGFAEDEPAVNVTGGPIGGPATAFFSWSKSAIADGRDISVAMTSIETEPYTYDLYMAYALGAAQRAAILHDPVLGVDSVAYRDILSRTPPLQADFVLYVGSLAGISLLVALTIFVANRRRKKREE